jgi:hypothetical protein
MPVLRPLRFVVPEHSDDQYLVDVDVISGLVMATRKRQQTPEGARDLGIHPARSKGLEPLTF